MSIPSVVLASEATQEQVLKAASLAFCADPFMRWIMPSAPEFLPGFMDMVGLFAAGVSVADRTTFHTEQFEGVAIWLKPNVHGDEEGTMAWIAEHVREDIHADLGYVLESMGNYRAQNEPCWYLSVLGVDPAFQRQGLGSVMMKHVTRIVDELGLPAYLESSNPDNISLYLRHGFEVVGQIQKGTSPVVTPMMRPAR